MCQKANSCVFFKKYSTAQGSDEKIKSFLNDYCNGDKYEECKIKQVMNQLGEKTTPNNLMPDGNPTPGSDDKFWSEGVKLITG